MDGKMKITAYNRMMSTINFIAVAEKNSSQNLKEVCRCSCKPKNVSQNKIKRNLLIRTALTFTE
jgi:hypothetical protein